MSRTRQKPLAPTTADGKARCQHLVRATGLQCKRAARPGFPACGAHKAGYRSREVAGEKRLPGLAPALTHGKAVPATARRELFKQHPEFQELYDKYAAWPLGELTDVADLLVELRALRDFSALLPTKNRKEFVHLRMSIMQQTSDIIAKLYTLHGRSEAIEQQVNARIAQRVPAIILGFERVLSRFVPPDQWEDAIEELQRAVALPTAELVSLFTPPAADGPAGA